MWGRAAGGERAAAGAALAVDVAPGLSFRFTGLPGPLRRRLGTRLAWQLGRGAAAGGRYVEVETVPQPPPGDTPARPVLAEPPLVVSRQGERLRLELPGIVTWCDPDSGRAALAVRSPGAAALGLWAQRVLPALLAAAAEPRGWLLLHAASMARNGLGLLLPGPGGAGKSTLFGDAVAAGWDGLSDDLTWVRERARGWKLHPFPAPGGAPPAVAEATLRAVVLPAIEPRERSVLEPCGGGEAVRRIVAQAALLGGPRARGSAFRRIVRMVAAVPCLRLRAGRDRGAGPALLAGLLTR